jgi:DNA-binding transcriptional regulator YdaS (Cro superfamily)
MRTADAIQHYGSRAAIARALGLTPSAVSQWGETVPELSAWRLWMASGGRLALDPWVYARHGDAR